MSVLTLRFAPDAILRQICVPVTVFDSDLVQFCQDMLDTMYAAPGRGLAAPQVGSKRRIFVMDVTWKDADPSPSVFVNPKIVARSDTQVTQDEGCLSIPDVVTPVTRPGEVTLQWQTADGAEKAAVFKGFAAACIQHEIDHLDGILCTDYAA